MEESCIPRGYVAPIKLIPRGYGNRSIYRAYAKNAEGGLGEEPSHLMGVKPRKGKPQEFEIEACFGKLQSCKRRS
jgi:hypothetical protein